MPSIQSPESYVRLIVNARGGEGADENPHHAAAVILERSRLAASAKAPTIASMHTRIANTPDSRIPCPRPDPRPGRPHAAKRKGEFLRALPGILAVVLLFSARAFAVDIERDPINYSQAKDANVITRLEEKILAGTVVLQHDEQFGYLPALLKALGVSTSSQTLVFSKTSLQLDRIGPRTPRAIYFNDDVFVGYCHRSEMLEITAADPKLGAVFYAFDQDTRDKPKFRRQTNRCLLCHASSSSQGMPGNVLTSVYPESDGQPNRSMDFFRVDHSTPFQRRWGGWYVSGTTGGQVHLGNMIVKGIRVPDEKELAATSNLVNLEDRFRPKMHLTPHSDVVALMVMEHQAEMHNRLTRANFLVRDILFGQPAGNPAAPEKGRSAETERRIRDACEPAVRYLLFSGEIPLTDPVKGTTPFAGEFAARGPKDQKGRSLHEFDLKRRLFKYPCSYMIYSEMFDTLPEAALECIYRRLWDILHAKSGEAAFEHLSEGDRQAIIDILRETKTTLPAYWK